MKRLVAIFFALLTISLSAFANPNCPFDPFEASLSTLRQQCDLLAKSPACLQVAPEKRINCGRSADIMKTITLDPNLPPSDPQGIWGCMQGTGTAVVDFGKLIAYGLRYYVASTTGVGEDWKESEDRKHAASVTAFFQQTSAYLSREYQLELRRETRVPKELWAIDDLEHDLPLILTQQVWDTLVKIDNTVLCLNSEETWKLKCHLAASVLIPPGGAFTALKAGKIAEELRSFLALERDVKATVNVADDARAANAVVRDARVVTDARPSAPVLPAEVRVPVRVLRNRFSEVRMEPSPKLGNPATEAHFERTTQLLDRSDTLMRAPLTRTEQAVIDDVMASYLKDAGRYPNHVGAWAERLQLYDKNPEVAAQLTHVDKSLMDTTAALYAKWGDRVYRDKFASEILHDAMVLAIQDGKISDVERIGKLLKYDHTVERVGLDSTYFEVALMRRLGGSGNQLDVMTGTVESVNPGHVIWDLGAGDYHGPIAHLMQRAFAERVLGREAANRYFAAMTRPQNEVLWGAAFEPSLRVEGEMSVSSMNFPFMLIRNEHIGLPAFDP